VNVQSNIFNVVLSLMFSMVIKHFNNLTVLLSLML
jgi:hypothetical protein